LGGLKVGGIEAFSEPTVYFGEQSACFVVPALLFAEARQTCGRSELPGFAELELRGCDCLTKAVLSSALFVRPRQQCKFAVEAQQFGLLTELIAPLGKDQALVKRLFSIVEATSLNVSVAENAKEVRKPNAGTGCPVGFKSPREWGQRFAWASVE